VLFELVALALFLSLVLVLVSPLACAEKIKDSLGVNLEGNVDWQVSNYFVDAVKSSRGWGRVDAPWVVDAPVDDHGWPLGDAGIVIATCDAGFSCGGTYLLSFEGTAEVSIAFYGSVQQMTVVDGTHSYAEVPIPPLAPTIMLVFTNTGSGVRDVRLLRPGYPRNTTKLYTDDFLLALSPFSAVRVMDLVKTNDVNFVPESPYFSPAPILWANRSLPTDATQSGHYGVCWEYIIQLANEAAVDLWVNVPYNADDLYITSLVALLNATLDPSRLVYLEYSNEVWNWQFAQAQLNLWKAQRDDEASGQHLWMYAKETVRLSNLTRAVVGDAAMGRRYRVVLGIQIGWSPPEWPLLDMLSFVRATYGPPARFFYGFASAPYYAEPLPEHATNISAVHEYMIEAIDSYAEPFSRMLLIAEENGLMHLAYEGGPHHQGQVDTNLEVRMSAHRHPAMGAITKRYLRDTWYRGGGRLFCYFTLAGRYSRYGSWGATEDIRNVTTAKYRALAELSGEETPSVVYVTVSPTMAPTLSNLLTFYNHPVPVGSFEYNYQTTSTPVDQETVTSLWTAYMTGFDLQPGIEDYFFINGTLRFSSRESAPEGLFCIEVINADLLFFTRNSEGTLLSGTAYTVSFHGKGSGLRHVLVRVEEEANRSRVISQSFLLTAEWRFYEFSFVASGTGWFDFFVTSARGNFFDDFRVLPASSSSPSVGPSGLPTPTPRPSLAWGTAKPTAWRSPHPSRWPSLTVTAPSVTASPTRQPTSRPTVSPPHPLSTQRPTALFSQLATPRPTAQASKRPASPTPSLCPSA
jgi:hypothetical protein